MTFEKAIKEVDRMLVHCDNYRAKLGKIDAQIEELKKKRNSIEDKWSCYNIPVDKARDIISDALKRKYKYLVGGYFTVPAEITLGEAFHFKVISIGYGWNEVSIEHRDMLTLIVCTATKDKEGDLVLNPEHKFRVYGKDILPSSKENFCQFISEAKHIYELAPWMTSVSGRWDKNEITSDTVIPECFDGCYSFKA